MANGGKKYRDFKPKGLFKTALLLLLFFTVLCISTKYLLPGYWYFWLLTVISALLMLQEWHTRNLAYSCPRCGTVFEVSALEGLLGPNGINKRYLKCPLCRRKAWVDIIRIKKASVPGNKLLFEEQDNTGYEKRKG